MPNSTRRYFILLLCSAALALPPALHAQASVDLRAPDERTAELHLHLVPAVSAHSAQPSVAWLTALPGTTALTFQPHGRYVLLQKSRMFQPHLQVIPVGSVVQFPNADPFFHNVFSLFDGRRFDLGLYEADTTKSVTFPREGVSYIFCNIHPEMSAVVLSLSTPLYSIANPHGMLDISNVPPGDYLLHIWIEGVPQSTLNGLDRRIHLAAGSTDLGDIKAPHAAVTQHANKFGGAYDTKPHTTY